MLGQVSFMSIVFTSSIAHRTTFSRLYQKSRSPEAKAKFRQAGNCYKKCLESAKLVYANKTKKSITSQRLHGMKDEWIFPES